MGAADDESLMPTGAGVDPAGRDTPSVLDEAVSELDDPDEDVWADVDIDDEDDADADDDEAEIEVNVDDPMAVDDPGSPNKPSSPPPPESESWSGSTTRVALGLSGAAKVSDSTAPVGYTNTQ